MLEHRTMASRAGAAVLGAALFMAAVATISVYRASGQASSEVELVVRGRRPGHHGLRAAAAIGSGAMGPGAGTGRPVFVGLQLAHERHAPSHPIAGTPESRSVSPPWRQPRGK